MKRLRYSVIVSEEGDVVNWGYDCETSFFVVVFSDNIVV